PVTDDLLVSSAGSSGQLEVFRALGIESAIVVPLRGRARVLGAMAVVSAESGRRLDDADLAVAVDLARKAGLAVENAQHYQRARQVAEAFEQGLVPDRLATVPGLNGAARYLPAAAPQLGRGADGDLPRAAELGAGRRHGRVVLFGGRGRPRSRLDGPLLYLRPHPGAGWSGERRSRSPQPAGGDAVGCRSRPAHQPDPRHHAGRGPAG